MLDNNSLIHSRHPTGLWCLAAICAVYCFGFGTITSLLVLYLTKRLGISASLAYSLFAAVNSLLFTLPLIGGYLSGKLGYKYAAVVGAFVCFSGTIFLNIPTTMAMYIGVAAFVVGNGLFTPATYAMVGLCYDKYDTRRESGYTLFYLLFNIGFLLSTSSGGYIAQYFGYNQAFLIAAFAFFCAFIVLCLSLKWIQPAPGSSMAPQVSWRSWQILLVLILISMIGLPICQFLFEHVALNNALLWVLIVVASFIILWLAKEQKDHLARLKLLAFLLLSIISIAFWALYMLEPSLLTVFIDKNVNRHIGPFTIPPSTYYALDSFFVIVLGLFFSWLWKHLSQIGKDPSLPTKFASSLLCMGLGYLIIVVGIHFAGSDQLTNSLWIVLGYILFAAAELLISPIGLSMVGRLMPHGKDGLGMGVWQLFTGLSAVISGYLANMAVVPSEGLPVETNPIFAAALTKIGSGTILVGIIAVLLIPLIKRLIRVNL